MRLAIIGVYAQAMEFQTADPLCQLGIIRDHQAAFRAGHVFNGVEGENCRSFRAHVTVFVIRAGGMGRIFNHRNTVTFTDGMNCVDITRRAGIVNGNNGFSARGNSGFHGFWRHH